MDVGMVGLGKMGGNMSRRLHNGGHRVVAYDQDQQKLKELEGIAEGASSLEDICEKLPRPRVVWCMLPAGEPTNDTIGLLAECLAPDDIVIDGGNSFYKDSIHHAEQLARKRIRFLDAGVSGGIWGLEEGYCLMVGGDKNDFSIVEPVMRTLAQPDGCAHVGPVGSGHFVKMIHNGIEYAMLEAYGEGFELLKVSRFGLDLHQIASVWLHGSVVRSWLLELAERVLSEDAELADIRGYVADSGEGRWTVEEAIQKGVAAPVITDALFARYRSRECDVYSAKLIAALRNQFGGHSVVKERT
jgi:6-phosphogluconate dehydrogenase